MTEISPYYEPGAPPPTLPILVAQTEIGMAQSPSKLLAQEEIGSGPTLSRLSSGSRFTPYPKLALRRTPSHFPVRSTKPNSAIHPQPGPKSAPPANTSSQVVSSDADTDSSDESSTDSECGSLSDVNSNDEQLIPKPEGEAGRPGRGGYNLEETLAWDSKEYRKIKVVRSSNLCDF